jgi:triacylglycerol lipase
LTQVIQANEWQAGSISLMARNPVLLVHGIDDTVALFRRMRLYLERGGLSVHALNLIPNNGTAGLAELAKQLDRHVRASFATDQAIDVVGFSMGGLVSRYYIQRLGGIHRVRRFVTIGTPHRGTWTAFLRANAGARDMRPGSPFLRDLNRDVETLDGICFTSIWTPFDLMIVPSNSSRVPAGRSISVRTPAHPLLVRDPRVLRLILGILSDDSKSVQDKSLAHS